MSIVIDGSTLTIVLAD